MSIETLYETLKNFKASVKEGRILSEEMKGSTFAISNLGMTGIERFDAMINGNDCGIAAIGAEKEGKISVTLTLDHRIVNGWQGAAFMQTLKTLVEDPLFFKDSE
jgi:pyruvate dehydrogenase E2 component (dihydrolipoamide acetyltransferase)